MSAKEKKSSPAKKGCLALYFIFAVFLVFGEVARTSDESPPSQPVESSREQNVENYRKRKESQKESSVVYPLNVTIGGEINTTPTSTLTSSQLFSGQGEVSKSGGEVRFEVPKGRYRLKVSCEGCEPETLSVEIPKNKNIAVSLTGIPGYWEEREERRKRDAEEAHRLANPLEILDHTTESGEYSWSIVGRVRNNTDSTKEYIQIEASILNSQGELLDTAMDNTRNLRPGQVWKFEMAVFDDEASRYRIEEVKDSPF